MLYIAKKYSLRRNTPCFQKNIHTLENNIHADTKYLSVLRDRYFSDDALDSFQRTLFTMAGYDVGPNRINRLRKEAEKRKLDPNQWFKLTLVTNKSASSRNVEIHQIDPDRDHKLISPLNFAWPAVVYSLSHVALPFPPDDTLYGGDDAVERPWRSIRKPGS